jgi:hypothetical protein
MIRPQNYPQQEIRGCDGYTCSRIDKTDRENKTQEEIES